MPVVWLSWRDVCTPPEDGVLHRGSQDARRALPHFVLRYRQLRPEGARDALLATHGGLSLELCAVICHISPMALYRLVCALGHQGLVTVLTRCGLPLHKTLSFATPSTFLCRSVYLFRRITK